ncbi:glucosaminidase domain-containing protein [Flavobacterium algicola]|uniref:glucosaminidase domain-containing protein n=1 Tax=Flavobacterium algicola TaxID=556529 RepID=UPI001EFC7B4A|nr:glucosaminidase domain-containing protein [Flavobacterium algicola]MCG9791279.1 glucosaminidase domain-containing protein [Flavobacterium algicola]
MIKKFVLVLSLVTFVSCHSSKSTTSTSKKSRNSSSSTMSRNQVVNGYVDQYKGVAMSNMKKYGIPASIILAQGILESGAGRSELAADANNHFGIKCHNNWLGETIYHDDDKRQECFRKYRNPADSYEDHAVFLTSGSRYASLFNLKKDDYEGWAKGLRAAGYATDTRYPSKLITYIETYDLSQYDAQVLGRNYSPTSTKRGNNNTHEVEKGDTLYSISKRYNVSVDDLIRKNNLSDNTISIGQKLKIN